MLEEEEEPWKLVAAIAANSRKKAPRVVRLANENDRVAFVDLLVEKNVILWDNNTEKGRIVMRRFLIYFVL